MRLIPVFAVLAVFVSVSAADAQTLSLQCKKISASDVVCRGLFSDGEMAGPMTVKIFDAKDTLVTAGKTDIKGEYAFKAPAGEYHVVIADSKVDVASIASEDIW